MVTKTFSTFVGTLLIFDCFIAIASLKSGSPAAGPYRVFPSFNAFRVASIINLGVLKSGSPALKLQMFFPSAFRAFAFALISRVRDGSVSYTHLTLPTTPYV